jgi:Glycosyl hydrolases family 25
MLHAIDVSHHQSPAALDWGGMRLAGCDVCIVRLTYGTTIDEAAAAHIAKARDAGFTIGAYAFFRASLPVQDQFNAFCRAALLSGYGKGNDMVPALDVEDDTAARPLLPAHAPLAREYSDRLGMWKGQDPLLYITQRDWGRLGSPAWMLTLPLFVAHYSAPSRPAPATPNGMQYALWQDRVGPFQLGGPHGYYEPALLDQSIVRELRTLDGDVMTFDNTTDEELRDLRADPAPSADITPEVRAARIDAMAAFYQAGAAARAQDRLFDAKNDMSDDGESVPPPPGEPKA